jgi:hypothetical protein
MAPVFGTLAALGSTLAATVGSTAAVAGTALGGAGGVASAIGTGLSAAGSIYSGIQQNAAAKVEAKQLKTKGDAEYAAAQVKARETRREKDLVMSRQRAVAAASGGGVSNETVEGLMAKTEQRGEYSALLDMYNGAVMRNDLYNDAAATRASGKSALTGSIIGAGSTVASGAGDIYSSARSRRRSATLY